LRDLTMMNDKPYRVVSPRLPPHDGDDLFHWRIVMSGPPETPYAGYTFELELMFPADYPLKGIKIMFSTKIYHVSVCNGGFPYVFGYSPAESVCGQLDRIYDMLSEPDKDWIVNCELWRLYQTDRECYEATVREWMNTNAVHLPTEAPALPLGEEVASPPAPAAAVEASEPPSA